MQDFKNYLNSFVTVPEPSMMVLLDLFTEKELAKNAFLAQEGEYAKKLYFLREGVVRAYYQNEEGEEYNKLLFTGPAIVAAYSSLITGNKNIINIQCLTPVTVYETSFERILQLYPEHRSIETLNRTIAENFFVEKEKREMSLVMHNATKRYEQFQIDFPELDQKIPQYHIASYLGITPTQLSRIRKNR